MSRDFLTDPPDSVSAPPTWQTLLTFASAGAVAVGAGQLQIPMPFAAVVQGVRAAIGTAPTGADLIVDLNKNGASLFTDQTQRPKITATTTLGAKVTPPITALAAGDLLSVDVDQIGSTIAGSDLSVVVDLVSAVTTIPLAFGQTGALTVNFGATRIPLPPGTLKTVRLAVGTAPTGADIIVDVNKNGTTVFTDQTVRPKILAGQAVSALAGVPAATATLADGDYLTVDVDQVGATVAGSDLAVVIEIAR